MWFKYRDLAAIFYSDLDLPEYDLLMHDEIQGGKLCCDRLGGVLVGGGKLRSLFVRLLIWT